MRIAPLAHLVQAARSAVRPGSRQRGERAAVAVGAERELVLARPAGPCPVARSTAGIWPWTKNRTCSRPKWSCASKKRDRRLVVLGAGHDVERQRLAVPPAQGDDLLGVDLEQAGRRDRADREGPLGSVEAQPGARAAGDQDHADLARRQRVGADLGGVPPRHPLAVGLRQPRSPRSAGPARRPRPRPARRAPARRSTDRAARRSIAAISPRSRACSVGRQVAPPREQVPLTVPVAGVRPGSGPETFATSHSSSEQPHDAPRPSVSIESPHASAPESTLPSLGSEIHGQAIVGQSDAGGAAWLRRSRGRSRATGG